MLNIRSCSSTSKLKRALLNADIVAIKQSLDRGMAVSTLSGGILRSMGSLPKSSEEKKAQVSKKRKPNLLAAEQAGMPYAAPVAAPISKGAALETNQIIHDAQAVSIMHSMIERRVKSKLRHGLLETATIEVRINSIRYCDSAETDILILV